MIFMKRMLWVLCSENWSLILCKTFFNVVISITDMSSILTRSQILNYGTGKNEQERLIEWSDIA